VPWVALIILPAQIDHFGDLGAAPRSLRATFSRPSESRTTNNSELHFRALLIEEVPELELALVASG
jgi:hypothetical protein